MKFYVFLGLFLFSKATNPRESIVYFKPTGKYFPTENWPNTSENQRQGNIGMQNTAPKQRTRRGAQAPGNVASVGTEITENSITREVKPLNKGEERILIATVETREEALKLIDKLKKANRKGTVGSYIEKVKKRYSNEDGSRNTNPKRGFRIWGVKKYKEKKAIWAF